MRNGLPHPSVCHVLRVIGSLTREVPNARGWFDTDWIAGRAKRRPVSIVSALRSAHEDGMLLRHRDNEDARPRWRLTRHGEEILALIRQHDLGAESGVLWALQNEREATTHYLMERFHDKTPEWRPHLSPVMGAIERLHKAGRIRLQTASVSVLDNVWCLQEG